jgi:hypothetical protein
MGILEGQSLRDKSSHVIVLRQVCLNMITRAQKVLILKVRISNTFCKSVRLVYEIKVSLQEMFYFCFNPLLQFYARGPVLSGTLCSSEPVPVLSDK